MLSPMRSGSGLFCAVKRGLGGFISPQSAPVFPRLAPARPAESSGVTSDLLTNREPVPQTDVASDDTSDDIDVEEPPPPETDILP